MSTSDSVKLWSGTSANNLDRPGEVQDVTRNGFGLLLLETMRAVGDLGAANAFGYGFP
jgi:hypothetical protein